MIMNGLKTGDRCVVYGSRDDVCFFCAEERAIKNREAQNPRNTTREAAARELRGQAASKPLFRFPISGGPYFICQDHMHKFVNKMDSLKEWEDPNKGLPIEEE